MKPTALSWLVMWLSTAPVLGAAEAPRATEPSDPKPSAAVEKILDEVRELRKSNQSKEALAAAERAGVVAKETQDGIGAASASRARALVLQDLRRGEEAAAAWRETDAAWERLGDGPGRIEALASLGLLLGENAKESEAVGKQALTLGRSESKRPFAAAQALHTAGEAHMDRSRLAQAREYFQAALSLQQSRAADSLAAAASLNGLGRVAQQQGNLAAAGEYFQKALAIQKQQAPSSLDLAESLNNLGIVAQRQGNLAAAGEYLQRALAIQEQLAPNSLAVAKSLNSLGNVAREWAHLAVAGDYHRRALAIQEQLAPNSLAVAKSLNNLGIVAWEQGDLAAAREYFQSALAIKEQQAPNSLDVATSLNNLGIVAWEQGDLAAAGEYSHRALAIQEQQAPNSLAVAKSLNNLGIVALERAELALAGKYFMRALIIQEQQAPNSLVVATCLGNLGVVARRQGDLAAAIDYHRRALAIREQQAPNSLSVANSLISLGEVAIDQRDLLAAGDYLRRAASIEEKLAPNSLHSATVLGNLGLIAEKQRDWREAEQLWQRAWEIVRKQAGSVSGDEPRQAFGASTTGHALNLMRSQLALGQPEHAFITLEQSRAQALQQLLAERKLMAKVTDAPLWSSYRKAIVERDHAEQAAAKASAAQARAQQQLTMHQEEGAPADRLRKAKADLAAGSEQLATAESASTRARVKVDQLWAEIKKNAPRVFAPSLTLEQAGKVLPVDTLYIAFSVGGEQTHLFLLTGGEDPKRSLSVSSTAVTQKQLQALVDGLRAHIANPKDLTKAIQASRSLFKKLFPEEARKRVEAAKRLLISPDGALWEVPFAALVTNTGSTPKYLGIDKAITYTQSLTVFAQSRNDAPRLPRGSPPSVVVLGHPIFDRTGLQTDLASRVRRESLTSTPPVGERGYLFANGKLLPSLESTRTEARAIARLYGADPLMEAHATEAELRKRIESADVVHLATHGYLNPVRAMSSGLLLTVPEKEPQIGDTDNDGVLQAWEIYSQLKLRAELVVLSACETGRGQRVRGEGIIGLTRALQYAGARSVVATQWKVDDRSAAMLMVAFHRNLRQGMAKDEALRQAMELVRKSKRKAHPYYWAAFFLTGDPDNPNLGAPDLARGS